MTAQNAIELTIAIDSVVRMREQQLWPHPEPLKFALAAERAGVDGVLLALQIAHVSVRDRDWRMLSELQTAKLCLAAPLRSTVLERVGESSAARCVLVPTSRHEHSSGGSLAPGVVQKALHSAAQTLKGSGIELGARIDPDPLAVRQCADAGLDAVELNTATFALASRPGSRRRRLDELHAAVQAARAGALRVSVRGGLDFTNVAALGACRGIAEVRIGQALVGRALLDGIEASIAKMRDLLGGLIE